MKQISFGIFLISSLLLLALTYAVHVDGVSLYYYTGEKVDGNVTIVPVENSANKTMANFTNGKWSIDFDMITEDVEYLTFIADDNVKIGYTQIKLDNDNPAKVPGCSIQNISLSGYAIDVNNGNPITSGNVRVSIVETGYMNTTSFYGEWNIDFHPCLISGNIYTLYILISDNTGKTGEMFQSYPAR